MRFATILAAAATLALAASGCGVALTLQQTPAAELGDGGRAVAYSGYRAGQHPDRGDGAKDPSEAQILEDLQILARDGRFKLIRLYDSQGLSEIVLRLIAEHDLKIGVMLGAWLNAELSAHETCAWLTEPIPDAKLAQHKEQNAIELQRAIRLANAYPQVVVAVNVGNEALVTWNDHLVSIEAMVDYVKQVKAAIAQPVTTADNYMAFVEHADALRDVLDFAAVHTYPAWENKTIDEAMDYTIANMMLVREALPEMPLAIGEAGWASVAVEFGDRASEAIQTRYYDELTAWADANHITTFVFEAFDEPWKGHLDNADGAEKHWGLFTVDRVPKQVMRELYAEQGVVEVVKRGDGYALMRNGAPYVIKGVGGTNALELAVSMGANSVRTWGSEEWPKAFEKASRLGMTVFAGVWLSHQASDYDDAAYLDAKRAEVEALAKQWATHPSLLVWCLGNEIQLHANIPKAWQFVEELAQIIRRYDTNHPIATATAHSPPEVLDLIVEHAPSIGLLAVNSYAGLPVVTRDIERSTYTGAFVITEWGPNGHWETGKTAWGRPLEQSSAEKVALYRDRAAYIASLPTCVGSYVFLWGQKQERTPTWYSMFVETRADLGLAGEATGAVDVMQQYWSGTAPDNHAPVISALTIGGKAPGDSLELKAGTPYEALATAMDADGDTLSYVWELLAEPTQLGEGGSHEGRPPAAADAVIVDGPRATGAIAEPGEYRLFVYALDGRGKVGTANFPVKVVPAKKARERRR